MWKPILGHQLWQYYDNVLKQFNLLFVWKIHAVSEIYAISYYCQPISDSEDFLQMLIIKCSRLCPYTENALQMFSMFVTFHCLFLVYLSGNKPTLTVKINTISLCTSMVTLEIVKEKRTIQSISIFHLLIYWSPLKAETRIGQEG